jgi:predicted enzyme related to lactoylglutathione lyase
MRARRAPPDTELMDAKIEVIKIPVSDVDRALAFYTEQAGFHLDVDYHPASGFRVVQLTPPCSVQVGLGLTDAAPGSARAIYLIVTDIEAARRELTGRGSRSATSGTSRRSATGRAAMNPAPTRTATPGCSRRSATGGGGDQPA